MDMQEYATKLLSECDTFRKELEQNSGLVKSLGQENYNLRKRLAVYAEHIHMLIEGDTHHMEELYSDLRADGFADEDGFPLYPEGLYGEEYRDG